jgi:hypothetical protein
MRPIRATCGDLVPDSDHTARCLLRDILGHRRDLCLTYAAVRQAVHERERLILVEFHAVNIRD